MNNRTAGSGASPDAAVMSNTIAVAQQRLRDELALPSRLAHVMLLLVAIAMATVLAALLITESSLPPRTRLALSIMLAIAVSWVAFAVWVLRTRRVLLAEHQVLAARMAVVFSVLFSVGAATLAPWSTNSAAALSVVGTGVVMLVFAGVRLLQADRRQRALQRRRAELMLQIQSQQPASVTS